MPNEFPLNPPNVSSNLLNQYPSYLSAHDAAIAISLTNPEIRYYLSYIEDDTYQIVTNPDDILDDYYYAGALYDYLGYPI